MKLELPLVPWQGQLGGELRRMLQTHVQYNGPMIQLDLAPSSLWFALTECVGELIREKLCSLQIKVDYDNLNDVDIQVLERAWFELGIELAKRKGS